MLELPSCDKISEYNLIKWVNNRRAERFSTFLFFLLFFFASKVKMLNRKRHYIRNLQKKHKNISKNLKKAIDKRKKIWYIISG